MTTQFGKRLDGPGGRRTAARGDVLLAAAMMTLSSSRSVILLDVSKTGARMRVREPLAQGQVVWIKAQPADIFGTVVWSRGRMCGMRFDEPLDDDTLACLQTAGKVTMVARLSPEEQLAVQDWDTGLAR